MSFEKFLFYVFAATLLFAATMVITRRNPVHAVLFLVLAFFNAAALWMLAEAEFLAIVLVLVYVGAVMVLFLFVVMMLDIDVAAIRAGFIENLPLGILVGLLMAGEMLMVVGPGHFGLDIYAAPPPLPADAQNTVALGMTLFTEHLLAFELAAVILLVAIIAAIGLTLRRRPATRYQDPAKQVLVKARDRLKIIKMASEERD